MNVQVNPYLSFNGQCEAAFNFYAECFGVPPAAFFRFAGSPMADQVPPDWQNKIMHATLTVGSTALMGADAPPKDYTPPAGFNMSAVVDTVEDAERVFNAFARGGKVHMPLQQTFWSARFGMVADPFGITWLVQCEQTGSE
jgi:PhnB protein